MKRGLLASVAVVVAFHTATASAQDQPWLRDRRYREGIGVRAGDLELHPGVAAEFGYDSNYFLRAQSEGPIPSLRLRVTPSLSLSTLSPQRRGVTPGARPPDVEFRAGLSGTYNEFFPVSGTEEERDLISSQRNLGATVDLGILILPGRPFGASLYADAVRAVTPSNAGDTSASFNRIQPRAGGELIWTPGGGLLDWRVGYEFRGTYFESQPFSRLNNSTHQVGTRGRWRFLPRTALLYDATLGFIRYNAGGDKVGSDPLRTRLGINGLVTPSFGLLALAGWGASFYEVGVGGNQQDFDSVIGQVELKWYLTPNPSSDPGAATLTLSTLTLGVLRDFHDSFLGNFYERDRAYLNLSYFFSGRFLLIAEGGAALLRFSPIAFSNGIRVSEFSNGRFDASLFGEYRASDTFGINTTLRFQTNPSRTSIPFDPTNPALRDNLAWTQFEAFVGARWFM